jgi:peroxiredoxin
MLTVDQPAPDFRLPDLDGRMHALRDYLGGVVVINFWSAECPHAARADASLRTYLRDWGSRVALLSIASNLNETSVEIAQVAAQRELPLVLLDRGSVVADQYVALTTPHFFVIDEQGILRYQGALDDVTFRKPTPTHNYLHDAVEAVVAGARPQPAETPAYGCAIVRFAPD